MRTPKTSHRKCTRVVAVVAAAALLALPQVVQAAAKAGSGGGKGKPTTTEAKTDVATSVSDLADPVNLGDEVTYRVVVSNVSSVTARDLNVGVSVHSANSLGVVVLYSSVTPSKGSCSMARGGDLYGYGSVLPLDHSWVGLRFGLDFGWLGGGDYRVGRGSQPVCKIPTLAPGETSTIDVVVRPTYPSRYEDPSPSLRAHAYHSTIRLPCAGICESLDGNPENDRDGETTTVTTGSDAGDCVLTGVVDADGACAGL